MLAALMKSPTDYDPIDQPGRARPSAPRWCWTPWSRPARSPPAQRAKALAPVAEGLQDRRRTRPSQYFVDWVDASSSQAMGPPKNIDLVVETTLDARDEAAADAAAKATIDRFAHDDVEQAALVALDRPGRVRAMIGGADYAAERLQPRGRRPPPGRLVVEAVRLSDRAGERACTPDTPVVDQPVTIDGWSPRDFEPDFLGPITLKTALAQSVNTVAASLADEVGRPNVAATARRLGIVTPINTEPAMALGTSLVTPLEMAEAYDAFSNGGDRVAAYGIERIRTGRRGPDHLAASGAGDAQRDRQPAALASWTGCCAAVIASGTGVRAAIPGYDLAGKTGTTSRLSATPGSAASPAASPRWSGWAATTITPMRGITGGSAPAEFWKSYMRVALKRTPVTTIPAGPPAPLPPLIPTAAPAVPGAAPFGPPPLAAPPAPQEQPPNNAPPI